MAFLPAGASYQHTFYLSGIHLDIVQACKVGLPRRTNRTSTEVQEGLTRYIPYGQSGLC
jgi:hypothetical protein